MLESAQGTLDASEGHMSFMERGIFNIPTWNKVHAPPKQPSDFEVTVQMWKTVNYHVYRLRFTSAVLLRINSKDELRDTINYSQLAKVVVQSHHQYLTLHFEGAADPWTCWSDDHTNVVRELTQRTKDSRGKPIEVEFEAGAKMFDYAPSTAGKGYANVSAHEGGLRNSTAASTGNAEQDAFLDNVFDQLGTLENQAAATASALGAHKTLLEDQDVIARETDERLKDLNVRADSWLKSNS